MNTPQEQLVNLMKLKQAFFDSMGVKIKYVYKQDITYLMSLTTKEAEEIIDKVKQYLNAMIEIHGFNYTPVLGTGTCPFCVLNVQINGGGCDTCNYKKLHGKCSVTMTEGGHPKGGLSTWGKLTNIYDESKNRPMASSFLNVLQ